MDVSYAPIFTERSMISFLSMNGYSLEVTNEELIEFGLEVAQSHMDKDQIKAWIEAHKKVKEKEASNIEPNGFGVDD